MVRPGADGPKEGFIYASTDAYVLGVNWDHKVVIIDEAQCLTKSALKALLTRCSDTCKVIVIGSNLQVQGISNEASGFADCINHFAEKDWAAVCHLTRNYRGEVSAWADKM